MYKLRLQNKTHHLRSDLKVLQKLYTVIYIVKIFIYFPPRCGIQMEYGQ